MTTRWILTDQATSATLVLPRNPRAMAPLQPAQHTTSSGVETNGVVRVLRRPRNPFPWQFEGRTRTKAEYDALADWAKRGHVTVTDHLGRQHSVVPLAFEPTPFKPPVGMPANPWLFDYVFKALYLRRLS